RFGGLKPIIFATFNLDCRTVESLSHVVCEHLHGRSRARYALCRLRLLGLSGEGTHRPTVTIGPQKNQQFKRKAAGIKRQPAVTDGFAAARLMRWGHSMNDLIGHISTLMIERMPVEWRMNPRDVFCL